MQIGTCQIISAKKVPLYVELFRFISLGGFIFLSQSSQKHLFLALAPAVCRFMPKSLVFMVPKILPKTKHQYCVRIMFLVQYNQGGEKNAFWICKSIHKRPKPGLAD
jgi:hypothetical protein